MPISVARTLGACLTGSPPGPNSWEQAMKTTEAFRVIPNGTSMFMLSGELDIATRPILNEAIAGAVAAGGPIVLDLSGVTFMDSTGIGAILAALKDLPSGCIVLHGVHGAAKLALDLTGVGSMRLLHVVPCAVLVEDGLAVAR
jgi:anti-sigma B factor antagonist